MEQIRIEEYAKLHIKSNPDEKYEVVVAALKDAVKRKRAGATCYQCGQPIWALGSAVVGYNVCFTCATGETDSSEDYEVY